MSILSDLIKRDVAANRPAAGIPGRLFYDTTNAKFQRDNGSTWEDCEPTATTMGSVATDLIWDAAGDIVQGSGANTAERLAIGAAFQTLRVNSGANALEYAGGKTRVGQVVVGSGGVASISFSSIPGSFEILELYLMGRFASAAAIDFGLLSFNDDAGSNYDYYGNKATSTTVAKISGYAGSPLLYGYLPAATAAAGCAGQAKFTIPGYARTVFHKTISINVSVVETSDSNSYQLVGAGRWRSTSAINKITLSGGSYYAEGTVATLYGIS